MLDACRPTDPRVHLEIAALLKQRVDPSLLQPVASVACAVAPARLCAASLAYCACVLSWTSLRHRTAVGLSPRRRQRMVPMMAVQSLEVSRRTHQWSRWTLCPICLPLLHQAVCILATLNGRPAIPAPTAADGRVVGGAEPGGLPLATPVVSPHNSPSASSTSASSFQDGGPQPSPRKMRRVARDTFILPIVFHTPQLPSSENITMVTLLAWHAGDLARKNGWQEREEVRRRSRSGRTVSELCIQLAKDPLRPGYGQAAARLRPGCGQAAARLWPGCGQAAARQRPGCGQTAARQRPGNGQAAAGLRPGSGQAAAMLRPGCGQAVARLWPCRGQATARHRPGNCPATARLRPSCGQGCSHLAASCVFLGLPGASCLRPLGASWGLLELLEASLG